MLADRSADFDAVMEHITDRLALQVEGRFDRATIRTVVHDTAAAFDGVPVQAFVATFVERRCRDHLKSRAV